MNESRAPDSPPPGIDTSRPNIARVYDYLLGGKDNFTVDRELAGQLLSVNPDMEQWARSNAADEGPNAELRPAYTAADAFRHTHEEFTSFFAGTEIVPPGIAEARRWIADLTAPPPEHGLYVRCGAGIKR